MLLSKPQQASTILLKLGGPLARPAGRQGVGHGPRGDHRRCLSATGVARGQLTADNVKQNFRKLEYAVRGPLVIRALQLRRELKEGHKKPFKSVITANIGDCQAMLQKPITFIRQVLAGASDKSLLADSCAHLPDDVKERARELLAACDGQSVGAYSETTGVELVRRHVAEYITERDQGVPSDWHNVFMCAGATAGIKILLSLINECPPIDEATGKPGLPVGVMIPIPQYPLYSATLCEFGMHQVDYYLNEDDTWQLEIEELERAYQEHRHRANIRALVVINPGNPTGSVLSEANIVEIINFAARHNLMLMADEVYQHNVYAEGAKFHSIKRVMHQKTDHRLELASLMSASKGFMGECGLRGGYCELANFSPEVTAILYKGLSSWLCPSILGQLAMDCVVRPPREDQPSYAQYAEERQGVLDDLKRKSKLVVETFNSVEGVRCNEAAGAMYAFPNLQLPPKAIEAAKREGRAPDFFYALQFLEQFGVCIVPGSGFGQRPGTYHFRTTVLPPADVFEEMMDRFRRFHADFLARYG